MKNAIVKYATEHDIQIPMPNEWKLIEKVIRLLQPFEEYTVLLSSSTGVRTMKQEFHDAVTSRFERILANENYIIASTVDPRFKTAFTVSQGHNLLLQEVERLAQPEDLKESTTATPENAEISARKENRNDLWACFDELLASSTASASVSEYTENPTPSEKLTVNFFNFHSTFDPFKACLHYCHSLNFTLFCN